MRDPKADPRVGDVIRLLPRLVGEQMPAEPLTVVAVTDRKVVWTRGGREHRTTLKFWRAEKTLAGPGVRMELVAEAAA